MQFAGADIAPAMLIGSDRHGPYALPMDSDASSGHEDQGLQSVDRVEESPEDTDGLESTVSLPPAQQQQAKPWAFTWPHHYSSHTPCFVSRSSVFCAGRWVELPGNDEHRLHVKSAGQVWHLMLVSCLRWDRSKNSSRVWSTRIQSAERRLTLQLTACQLRLLNEQKRLTAWPSSWRSTGSEWRS